MTLPRIAIIGRPNVGKSSLFNRLAGRRVSIVDATPGVTRDRVSTIIELSPEPPDARGMSRRSARPTRRRDAEPRASETPADVRFAELIDTGGYGIYTAEGKRYDDVGEDLASLGGDVERQIRAAITQAEIILLVVDAEGGLTALDKAIVEMIRDFNATEKVIPIANKSDSDALTAHAAEASALGFGQPMMVSALKGRGLRALRERLYLKLGAFEAGSAHRPVESELKIAIVGKRNSGKSSLINALAGEERVIVSEIAGTTRDSIDVRFDLGGRSILAIDTAGVRKRKSFADDIELYAHGRMMEAVKRADVVLLLVDASAEISQVDKKLGAALVDAMKPVVIVVNKWDLAEERHTPDEFQAYITQQLRGLEYAPIVFMSAARREGIREVIALAFNLQEQASHRETTGRLNAALKGILGKRGPSGRLGKTAKVYYTSQVATNPPTIVLVVNEPKLFHGDYERYLMNQFREVLAFSEVPMKLIIKRRERASLEDMKRKGRGETSAPGARRDGASHSPSARRRNQRPKKRKITESAQERNKRRMRERSARARAMEGKPASRPAGARRGR